MQAVLLYITVGGMENSPQTHTFCQHICFKQICVFKLPCTTFQYSCRDIKAVCLIYVFIYLFNKQEHKMYSMKSWVTLYEKLVIPFNFVLCYESMKTLQYNMKNVCRFQSTIQVQLLLSHCDHCCLKFMHSHNAGVKHKFSKSGLKCPVEVEEVERGKRKGTMCLLRS